MCVGGDVKQLEEGKEHVRVGGSVACVRARRARDWRVYDQRGVGDVGCERQVNEESHSARARFQPASEYHRKANGF